MMKPVAVALLFVLPTLVRTASADTTTTEADTLVVVTPNAPVVVQQGGPGTVAPSYATGSPMPVPGAGPVAAPSNGAPQNEDWNNVSHINGAPVKVGERNEYLYKFKKNNITGNPFGLFFGYYDVAFSHALGQNLALTLAVTGWNMDSGYTQGYQVAATLPLYFRRTFSGPFLEGGLLMRTDTGSDGYAYDCYDCSMSSTTWAGPELLFGWHWNFDSGLNIQWAFGVAKRMNSDASNEPDANGYFRVGYNF